MDCPHLNDSVKIDRILVKSKKSELIGSPGSNNSNNNNSSSNSSSSTTTNSVKNWRCLECLSTKQNWMCLNCGIVLCGRYENAHALNHASVNHPSHDVCLNISDYSVYCYTCDDFVINDTSANLIESLRQEFRDDDTSSEASTFVDESTSSSLSTKSQQQETASTTSSDSGWEEPLPAYCRRLRPRKRTISSDSGQETVVTKRKSLKKVVGLRNLGNTCFMNSVLQSLSNIQEFSCYFNALPSLVVNKKQQQQQQHQQKRVYHSRSLKENVHEANVVEELRKILTNLSHGGDGSKAISPECLFLVIWKVVPQFRGHRQHDAHEFLRYMLDRLHTELQHLTVPNEQNSKNKLTYGGGGSSGCGNIFVGSPSSLSMSPEPGSIMFKGRSSIVTNVFGGTLQSEVRCLICGMESKKHDPFLDLSLDIPEKFCNVTDDNNGDPVCHIADCLSSFTEIEELAETELYYCSSCKCKQKSTKRFWIRRLPNVLCLHIKRFRWNNFFRTKLDLRISFPITSMDMSKYVLNNGPETRRSSAGNNVYDLAAVIVHHGNGSSCGHYTSFAINNGTWLHFNDHTVKEVQSSAVAECKPYILFYIRRNANKTL